MTDEVINRTPKKPETNGLGLAGFIVSLVGICSGGVLSPIGLVLSIVGLFREPRGFAIAGVVLGAIGTAFTLFVVFVMGIAVIGALVAGFLAGGGHVDATIDGFQIRERVEDHFELHGVLPSTIDEVSGLDADTLQDHWGRPYRITIDPERQMIVVESDGADGEPGTEDDISIDFEIDD